MRIRILQSILPKYRAYYQKPKALAVISHLPSPWFLNYRRSAEVYIYSTIDRLYLQFGELRSKYVLL
jgi:hypothetical protein